MFDKNRLSLIVDADQVSWKDEFNNDNLIYSDNNLYCFGEDKYQLVRQISENNIKQTFETKEVSFVRNGILFYVEDKLLKNNSSHNNIKFSLCNTITIEKLLEVRIEHNEITHFVLLCYSPDREENFILLFDGQGKVVKHHPIEYDIYEVKSAIIRKDNLFLVSSVFARVEIALLDINLRHGIYKKCTNENRILKFQKTIENYLVFSNDNEVNIFCLDNLLTSMLSGEHEESFYPIIIGSKKLNQPEVVGVDKDKVYFVCNREVPYAYLFFRTVRSLMSYQL